MCEGLFPAHQVEKQLAINTPFCVSIRGHVPGVTPLDLMDDAFLQVFAEVHDMPQKCFLSGRFELLAGDRLLDTFGIDAQVCMNRKVTAFIVLL